MNFADFVKDIKMEKTLRVGMGVGGMNMRKVCSRITKHVNSTCTYSCRAIITTQAPFPSSRPGPVGW